MQERSLLKGIYLVSTPIGNLGDFSRRAVEVLQNSDLIACEDTRVTRKLLNRYKIKTALSSYHEFTTEKKKEFLIEKARNGVLSLVTDAGTPMISDPGYEIARDARKEDILVTAVPGACAVINALILSGADASGFFYGGWTPSFSEQTCVFFISPHKVIASLESLKEIFGGERKCSLVREMTKIYEEVITGTLDYLLKSCGERRIKGEITAVVHSGEKKKNQQWQEWMDEAMKYLPPSRAVQLISKIGDVPRREVYQYAVRNEKR